MLLMASCEPAIQPTATPQPTNTVTPIPTATFTPVPPTVTPIPVTPTPVDRRGSVNTPEGFVELRYIPSESGEVARIVNNLAPLEINGRSADGRWLQVTFPDGFTGWVQAISVAHSLNLETLNVVDSGIVATQPPPNVDALVKDGITSLRLRDAPSTIANVSEYLVAAMELHIVGRTEDNKWLQVVTQAGASGWVLSTYVDVYLDVDSLPVTGVSPSISFPHNAEVDQNGDNLRLRAQPSLVAEVKANLAQLTPLNVVGRTDNGQWLEVQTPDANQGWVAADYVDLYVDVATLPVTGQAIVSEIVAPSGPGVSAYNGIISNITNTTRQIYRRGQQLGNRPNVFSKVGDSITYAPYFLTPIGDNRYDLRDYGNLQPVVNFFLSGDAFGDDPFKHVSFAAANGSTSDGVLNPIYADRQWCQPDESQLVCEYRIVKPSVALIMFGTNDVIHVPLPDVFRDRLNRIVDISEDMGVIPVLSTIPTRQGYESQVALVNQIIVETARQRGVPLWDYAAAMENLPNRGIGGDGVHPSMPPYDTSPADFTAENLQYGYIVRNLTALQVLDALWRNVIAGG